jgi:hypothetical protein
MNLQDTIVVVIRLPYWLYRYINPFPNSVEVTLFDWVFPFDWATWDRGESNNYRIDFLFLRIYGTYTNALGKKNKKYREEIKKQREAGLVKF